MGAWQVSMAGERSMRGNGLKQLGCCGELGGYTPPLRSTHPALHPLLLAFLFMALATSKKIRSCTGHAPGGGGGAPGDAISVVCRGKGDA